MLPEPVENGQSVRGCCHLVVKRRFSCLCNYLIQSNKIRKMKKNLDLAEKFCIFVFRKSNYLNPKI